MTTQEISKEVLRILGGIAPEADLEHIRPDVPFRDQLDLDSMDFLNFVIALHKQFSVEIPETDYSKLATLEGCTAYLQLSATEIQRHGEKQKETAADLRG